jgi:hypothetical protein
MKAIAIKIEVEGLNWAVHKINENINNLKY